MALQPDDASRKFEKMLAKLLVSYRFKADECDPAKQQIEALSSQIQKYRKDEFEAYSTYQRLDKFFFNVLAQKPHFNVLCKVVKLVEVLSHGQAVIEHGSAENKEFFPVKWERIL